MSDTNYESLMDNEVGTASVVDVGSKDEEEVEEVVPVAASSSNVAIPPVVAPTPKPLAPDDALHFRTYLYIYLYL